MLQIATFQLPQKIKQANEFLATHKTENVQYFADCIYIAHEDGTYPVEYQIADWGGLAQAALAAKDQQEIALHMLEYERADLNAKHNKGRYDEISAGIQNCKKSISLQEEKIAFVQGKIAALSGKPSAK